MRNKIAGVFLVALGLLAHSAPLSAHHGAASFDDKILTLKGTETKRRVCVKCVSEYDKRRYRGRSPA